MKAYEEFIADRGKLGGESGFAVDDLPGFLFDFQGHLVDWSLRKGRAAIFADCGLGKTPMQLAWADAVARKTGGNVLILTPLAVSHQTVNEGAKFGIEVTRSADGVVSGPITVTNYERVHHFDSSQFDAVICDESSALKNFDSKRKKQVTEFMRRVPYRLLCTATAAPNDYHELGTSSEALGEMGYRDMLTAFFKQENEKDSLGWGRSKYRFRGHAERPFWRWVCSWARACRRPSDLGFSDGRFDLPDLRIHEHVVKASRPLNGMLFAVPANGMREEREERRMTINERCEKVAELVSSHDGPSVVWCHLNAEGDLLEKMIGNGKQVKGSMSEDAKEETLLQFTRNELPVLITKPKIGCWGLNWQHCSNVVTFPSHSFEQYYQAIRRCWRFGQQNPVDVHIVSTEGEQRVKANLRRKSEQADAMFSSLVAEMRNELSIVQEDKFANQQEVPAWL